jgi:hypothetical protein
MAESGREIRDQIQCNLTMNTRMLQDEILLERNPTEQSASCAFEFKGHHFHLTHHHHFERHDGFNRFECLINETLHEFGQVDFLGQFGLWPELEIEGKTYGFRLILPDEEGTYLIRFGVIVK